MIRDHNRRLLIRAFGHFVVSLLATLLTFAFWFALVSYGALRGSLTGLEENRMLISLGLVGVCYLAGFFHAWRLRKTLVSDHTDLFQPGGYVSDRGLLENHVNSYAANAGYALLTLFYAGPIRLLRAFHALRGWVHFSPILESELEGLLSRIRLVGEWHDARRYRDESSLLRQLIQMEQVDFSPHKGRIKAA